MNTTKNQENDGQPAHNLLHLFRNENKFSGKYGNTMLQYVHNNEEARLDRSFSREKLSKYFHRSFDVEKRNVSSESAVYNCRTFEDANITFIHEKNSNIRQIRAGQYLESLRVIEVMSNESDDVNGALVNFMEKLSEQYCKDLPLIEPRKQR